MAYINTIIWVKTIKNLGNSYNSEKLSDQADYILYYGGGIKNKIYKPHPPEKYTQEDELGRYYKTAGGHQKNTFLRKGKEYWPKHRYNEKPFYFKYYEWEGRGDRIGNTWMDISSQFHRESVEYPTQKPYKLLERIICLSTK